MKGFLKLQYGMGVLGLSCSPQPPFCLSVCYWDGILPSVGIIATFLIVIVRYRACRNFYLFIFNHNHILPEVLLLLLLLFPESVTAACLAPQCWFGKTVFECSVFNKHSRVSFALNKSQLVFGAITYE